ncbi:hypothetical protein [Aquabacterium sp.]|uniref:ArnT family glycosyltransferase n=1 Tax=Aquabacterium sp. TaxID=1872578 RepID=UPI002E342906|nr:hypothetical protein [Aquabacterium sp.]HEX5311743.1 hypothetical protein [Aquabacterium sp.]
MTGMRNTVSGRVIRSLLAPADLPFRCGVALTSLLLYAFFLWRAWFDYPNPYVDEAFFVPPAQAFAQAFTLFSPSLDPQRALHWMPPGYAVLCGLFMKATGISGLWGARLFSTVAFGLILLVLAGIGRRFNRLQFVVLYAPFLTLPLLTLSRIARMEAPYLLLALLSAWFLLRQRPVAAIALAVLSGLVHPNGAYVLLAVLSLAVWQGFEARPAAARRINGADVAWVALALVAGAAYVWYEWQSYSSFVADMGYQLQRKARGIAWTAPLTLVSLGAMAAGAWAALRLGAHEKRVLVAIGSSLIVSRLLGQELWYSPGYILGFTWIVLALLPAAGPETRLSQDALADSNSVSQVRSGRVGLMAAAVGLSGLFAASTLVLGWHGGRIHLKDAPLAGNVEQTDSVLRRLIQLKNESGLREVSCVPHEACLLWLEAATQAGLLVRFDNPLTHPPVGQECVWVVRANHERTTDADVRLTAGRIQRIDIKPCGSDWPDKDVYEQHAQEVLRR